MKNENYKNIKAFEDALKITNRPEVPEFSDVPEDMREYFQAQYKIIVITEAINGGWEPDWSDSDQEKWYPWFRFNGPSGFAFGDALYAYADAGAGDASRLCFESDEQAEYVGKFFVKEYEILLTK